MASASASFIDRRELAIGDQHLGLGMVEHEGDDRRVEPRVDRVQHAPVIGTP